MIYVAHPIDQDRGEDRYAELRCDLKESLPAAGIVSFWPSLPWVFGKRLIGLRASEQEKRAIDRVNQAALEEAEGILALLPDGVPSLGVPTEIEYGLRHGKTVVIVAHESLVKHSVQLTNWQRRGAHVTTTAHGAVQALVQAPRPTKRTEEANTVRFVGDGEPPQQAYPGDAGFDLVCSEDVRVPWGGFVDVPVDLAAELPPGVWGWVVGRSSTLRTRQLLVNQGIIDNGYRGQLFVGVHNLGPKIVEIRAGDRLAQLIPMPLLSDRLTWERVAQLGDSPRGTNGFGSSGC